MANIFSFVVKFFHSKYLLHWKTLLISLTSRSSLLKKLLSKSLKSSERFMNSSCHFFFNTTDRLYLLVIVSNYLKKIYTSYISELLSLSPKSIDSLIKLFSYSSHRDEGASLISFTYPNLSSTMLICLSRLSKDDFFL